MREYEGGCSYCGNIQPVLAMDQDDANLIITRRCDCGAAEREMQKNVMVENLKVICNGGDSGMPQMGEELTEKVISMAMLVFDGTAASITVEIGKSKVKIARSGEKIKTSRAMGRKLETTA